MREALAVRLELKESRVAVSFFLPRLFRHLRGTPPDVTFFKSYATEIEAS